MLLSREISPCRGGRGTTDPTSTVHPNAVMSLVSSLRIPAGLVAHAVSTIGGLVLALGYGIVLADVAFGPAEPGVCLLGGYVRAGRCRPGCGDGARGEQRAGEVPTETGGIRGGSGPPTVEVRRLTGADVSVDLAMPRHHEPTDTSRPAPRPDRYERCSIAAGRICALRIRSMSNFSERSKEKIPFCSWNTSVSWV